MIVTALKKCLKNLIACVASSRGPTYWSCASTPSFHVASGSPNIFLKILTVPGPKPA